MSGIQDPRALILERGRLRRFVVTEPASAFGGLTPAVAFPVAPTFAVLATLSIFIDNATDRVWLNATVDWSASFAVIGTVTATFQLLRNGTVIYQTTESISSAPAIVVAPDIVENIVQLEHIDTTPVSAPATVTYTLQAQADVTGASTSGPVTLTAAEIERNAIA